MPESPHVRLERYAGLGPTVRLVHEEAVAALERIAPEQPALVYLDPPFATERAFALSLKLPEDLGGATLERVAYADRWDGLGAYLAFMDGVLQAVGGALYAEGSLLLHCDHRAAHHLAVACDRRFGEGARGSDHDAPGFRNELVWRYGLGGSSARFYPRKHDTILWYTRGTSWTFHPPMVPATSNRMRGQLKKAPDVLDVAALNNLAAERTGYPTQKPQALLELLVGAHTDPGELVVDVFSGSGTTAAAAWALGRRAFVADRGHDAIAVARTRLVRAGAALEVARHGGDQAPPTLAHIVEDAGTTWVVAPTHAPVVFAATGTWVDGVFDAHALPCLAHRVPSGSLEGALTRFERPVGAGGDAVLVRDAAGGESVLFWSQ